MRAASFSFVMAVTAAFGALPMAATAQSASKTPAQGPVAVAEKGKSRRVPALLQARAPVAGQPFDDREVELYIEAQGRKLLTADRIKKLSFERHSCALQIQEPDNVKIAWPAVDTRAEAATLVIGEFYRAANARETQFSVAAGAFIVTDSGACVTSLHVTKDRGSRGFCAMLRDGRVFPVREALAADPVNDLVILQLDLPPDVKLPTLPLASAPAPVGSSIVVMSHPDDRFYMLTAGIVARHTLWRDPAGDQSFMTITADFAKGSSGCPVLDEHGAVVGIVNNTESIYYADDGHKKQTDLQMVVKNTTPSWIVRRMIAAP
jgi:S1-C subfamily serine protease